MCLHSKKSCETYEITSDNLGDSFELEDPESCRVEAAAQELVIDLELDLVGPIRAVPALVRLAAVGAEGVGEAKKDRR